MIKKKGKEWCVYDSKGNEIACHPTKEKALRQLRAIEASKKRRQKKGK